MIDLLVGDSGVFWGWRSISLYLDGATHVYRSHLGGAKTMSARPVLKSRDGVRVHDERRWSPHGRCRRKWRGANATIFAKIFARLAAKNGTDSNVGNRTLRTVALVSYRRAQVRESSRESKREQLRTMLRYLLLPPSVNSLLVADVCVL